MERTKQITDLYYKFKKDSHKLAISHAAMLREKVLKREREIISCIFRLDLLGSEPFPETAACADIIFLDPPYGKRVQWDNKFDYTNPLERALERVGTLVGPGTIVVLALPKEISLQVPGLDCLKKFKFGGRKMIIYGTSKKT